jgi:hypothetical protein
MGVSSILWRSALFVEEIEEPGKTTDLPDGTDTLKKKRKKD